MGHVCVAAVDGTTPNRDSVRYAAVPIALWDTCTVKAAGFVNGERVTAMSESVFVQAGVFARTIRDLFVLASADGGLWYNETEYLENANENSDEAKLVVRQQEERVRQLRLWESPTRQDNCRLPSLAMSVASDPLDVPKELRKKAFVASFTFDVHPCPTLQSQRAAHIDALLYAIENFAEAGGRVIVLTRYPTRQLVRNHPSVFQLDRTSAAPGTLRCSNMQSLIQLGHSESLSSYTCKALIG